MAPAARNGTISESMSNGAPDGLPLSSFLTYELLKLTNRLNRQAAAILRKNGEIRLPEWRCMVFVGEHGMISLRDIHVLTEMDPALITRTTQALVKRGLVSLEKDGADRRLLNIRLTPAGLQTYQRLRPIMQARQIRLLGALTSEEQTALFSALRKVRDAVDQRQ